jgi:hypothetical protein
MNSSSIVLPNHAPHRSRPSRDSCSSRVPWAGSLTSETPLFCPPILTASLFVQSVLL